MTAYQQISIVYLSPRSTLYIGGPLDRKLDETYLEILLNECPTLGLL